MTEEKYWSIPKKDVLKKAESSDFGLTEEEARERLEKYGKNSSGHA